MILSCTKYSSSFPFKQIKANNNPVLDFPAVTVCNQNRISCYKLLTVMLNKLKENETEYNELEDIYLLSHCGSETLGCYSTLESYWEHFNQSEMPPEDLLHGDVCLTCEHILEEWEVACRKDPMSVQLLDEWWQKLGCFLNLSQSNGKPEPTDMGEIPESLAVCRENPDLQQPPSREEKEENSTDYFESQNLTKEENSTDYFEPQNLTSKENSTEYFDPQKPARVFSHISTIMNLNLNDSAPDADVYQEDLKDQPFSDGIGLRYGQQSTLNEYSEGTNKTTPNPASDKVSYLNLSSLNNIIIIINYRCNHQQSFHF